MSGDDDILVKFISKCKSHRSKTTDDDFLVEKHRFGLNVINAIIIHN